LVRFDINAPKPTLVAMMSNGSSQPKAGHGHLAHWAESSRSLCDAAMAAKTDLGPDHKSNVQKY
jgi:hypothetical protein